MSPRIRSSFSLRALAGFGVLLGAIALFPLVAFAQVAYRSAASAAVANSTITTPTYGATSELTSCGSTSPAIPSGSVGDLLVAQVIARNDGATVTMTGWNTLMSDSVAGQSYKVFLFWRSATGSDTSTVTQSGTCNHLLARITRFTNVDTAQPLETYPLTSANWVVANDGFVKTGTQAITQPNSMLMLAIFVANDRTTTQDAAFTQLYDTSDASGNDAAISMNYSRIATPATMGPYTNMDLSGGGNNYNHGVLFAVRPAPPTSLTITKPTGTADGDVLIASIAASSSAATITPPSGWTLVNSQTQSNTNTSKLSTYWLAAGASEPASYTWTFSGGARDLAGAISAYSGVDASAGTINAQAAQATGSSTSHATPTITTTVASTMLVSTHAYASAGTWAPPGSMTEAADVASRTVSNASGISLEMNYMAQATAASVAALTATASATADFGATQILALRPADNTCYTDNFNRSDGAPGTNWSVGKQTGSYTPVISGNRLRLTDTSTGVATWATLQRTFPGAGNSVTVEFDHYASGGTGGDGMAVILSNAAIPPVAGAFGGSLGYAQKSNPGSDCTTTGGCPGFAGGWLGVALDEFGNYSAATEGRYGGSASRVAQSVSVRGSGSGMSGYRFLTGTSTLSPTVDGTTGTRPHRYRISLDHTDSVHAYVAVERDTTGGGGTSYTTLLGCPIGVTTGCTAFDVKDAGNSQDAVPTAWLLSITGSTGGSTNTHEIDGLKVCTTQNMVVPSLHHIRIEHGGNACTGSSNPAEVTIKACADTGCTSLYLGSVTVDLTTTGGTWSADPVTFSGGETTVTLTRTSTSTVTLGGSATSPTTANATRCFNGTTEICDLNFATCTFDAVETGAAAYTPIFTKLSGTAFNLDIRNLSGSSQTVSKVEIVNASSGTCSTFTSLSNSTTTVPSSFTGSQIKSFGFNYANAVRNARIRIISGAGTSCSTDNFAIRPTAFTITSTATQTTSSGTPVFRAGNDPFSITVTSLPGYDGSPKLNLSSGYVTTTLANTGTVGGTAFSAAPSGTGVVTNSSLTYSEVGNFSFAQYAIYDDGFAEVDSSKSNPECTSDILTPNTANASGKYGCMFGAPAIGPLGRFVPNHFVVVGQVANACAAGSFTYFGEPISIRRTDDSTKADVVEARNLTGGVTKNYSGTTWGKGTVTFGLENADDGTNRTGTSPVVAYSAGSYPAVTGSWTNGVYTLGVAPPLNAAIQRPATPTGTAWGPFASLDIGLTVTDTDVSTSPRILSAEMEPAATGTCTGCTYKKLTGSPLSLRYGRLRLLNAYGSELLQIRVPVQLEYFLGSDRWTVNTADSCTAIPVGSVALGSRSPADIGSSVTAVQARSGSTGIWDIILAKPAKVGSLDIALNLSGATTATDACLSGWSNGPNATTSASLGYLASNWCGTAYDKIPAARVRFGSPKSPFIYLRERY